jgi:hypothetical protein
MPKPKMTADELESLIVREVRRHKHCDGFVSISINPSDTVAGTNLTHGPINYGAASQGLCDAALRGIIPRMQRDYDLRA